jgi:type I restriction enzyme, S subunit
MVWESYLLDEVCDVEYGTRVVRKKHAGIKFPVYGGGGATFNMDEYNREDCLIVSRFAMSEEAVRFVKGKFFLNDSGLSVKPKNKEKILQEFLNMFMFFKNDYIYGLGRGTAQRNLDVAGFRKIEVPIPPIPIQKKIVKVLDSAFEKIAKAKENSEANLKNAKEVFEVTIDKIFNNEFYKKSELSNIATFQYGYTAKSSSEGKYRYVRITDISTQGLLNTENKVYIPDFKDYRNYVLDENDLLMARTGASFGDVLLFENVEPSIFASYLIRIKFKINLKPKIYWFFSKSKKYWDQARKLSSGSAQPHFNGKALGKIIFSYPELDTEQNKIILNFEILNKNVQQLESIYSQKLSCLEELKQSILQKAFKGELTEVSS